MIDLTHQYIEMSAKAENIQSRRCVIIGNHYYDIHRDAVAIVGGKGIKDSVFNVYNNNLRDENEYTWIPSQHQLQKIYWNFYNNSEKNYKKKTLTYRDWMIGASEMLYLTSMAYNIKDLRITSFEQLWLTLIMFDLDGKLWNGRDWKKIPLEEKKRKKGKSS